MTSKTILLVEDNPDDVQLTLRAFRNHLFGNKIVVVKDGAEALEYLFGTDRFTDRDINDRPAVVFLDLNLPKVDGLEVLRRLRADPRTSSQPVVVLTSSKEQQDLATSYGLGANSYVRKPVNFEQFIEATKQLGLYWLGLNELPPPSAPHP